MRRTLALLAVCLPAAAAATEAPVSLTSSDGAGLKLVSYRARAAIEDPLAFTELHLTFRNPEQRTVEGRFEITLPPGATVSRFAMRQQWGWQEGEVVELQAAREAYEDFLHRRQDPALLEKQAGNRFQARVFPILAGAEKEIVISYSQELANVEDPYKLPLRGLPKLDALDIQVLLGKREVQQASSTLGGITLAHEVLNVRKREYQPDVDFAVPLPRPDNGQRLGLRHDNLVVARITPVTEAAPERIESLLVLVDTSASRALGLAEDVERLRAIVKELVESEGSQTPLKIACFDQEVREIYSGTLGQFGAHQAQAILDRRALGASDLSRALDWASQQRDRKWARVLLLGDGVATAGKTDGLELRKAANALAAAGVKRLDAIATGGIRDDAALKRLVTAGLAHDGIVLDEDSSPPLVAHRLTSATWSGIKIKAVNAAWVWPVELNGIQPGDQVLVYADLPPAQPLEIVLEGARAGRHPVRLAQVERPLIERAWIGARIQRLEWQRDTVAAQDPDLREALKKQIIDLSTKFRVLCDYTALLVLETEQDYARFHIDRRSLADILTVGADGVEVVNRRELPIAPPPPPVQKPTMEEAETKVDLPREHVTHHGHAPKPEVAKEEKKPAKRKTGGDALDDLLSQPSYSGPRTPPSGNAPAPATVERPPAAPSPPTATTTPRPAEPPPPAPPPPVADPMAQGDLAQARREQARAQDESRAQQEVMREVQTHHDHERNERERHVTREPDRDGDGIPDSVDRCPNEPETYNGYQDDDGCPDRGRVVVESSSITILERIHFASGTVTLAPESMPILDAIAQTLRANPQITKIEIQGHSDERGTQEYLIGVTQRRAEAVRRYLIDAGVDSRRLEARGYGATRPLCAGHTEECWARNRRVEFIVRETNGRVNANANAQPPQQQAATPPMPSPYEGRMAEVMALVQAKHGEQAIAAAWKWRDEDPGDVLALVALGEAGELAGKRSLAARAYGSIIDLFPSRADLRRFAGERLERLGQDGLPLAIDTYEKARAQRPDHPSSHRLLAYALVRAGRLADAFDVISGGARTPYPQGRFAGVDRILREDAGLIAAAWIAREPARRAAVVDKLHALGAELPSGPSLRFVLSWETDANDVDFHIYDAQGGHAFYQQKILPSGGELYADVTTGYGPECFTIAQPRAFPYKLQAHYYSRGPMGYGMGKLEIVQYDGSGRLVFDERPFVIMKDHAFVDLGTVDKPLK